jgi:hypothetical protein
MVSRLFYAARSVGTIFARGEGVEGGGGGKVEKTYLYNPFSGRRGRKSAALLGIMKNILNCFYSASATFHWSVSAT